MPIPFIFPIAGFLIASGGVGMIAKYALANQKERTRLDQWMTDALKWAFKTYLNLRFRIDLSKLTIEEEKAYWREFGARLQDFLVIAEAVAQQMYGKPFVSLKSDEQAEVIRRIAHDRGEPVDPVSR